MQQIEGTLKKRLKELTLLRAPEEAVGLILLGGEVIELLNTSKTPCENFEVHKAQLVAALENDPNPLRATLWHSHPGGTIGPSSVDIRLRTPLSYHLVLSLVDGDIVPTWY